MAACQRAGFDFVVTTPVERDAETDARTVTDAAGEPITDAAGDPAFDAPNDSVVADIRTGDGTFPDTADAGVVETGVVDIGVGDLGVGDIGVGDIGIGDSVAPDAPVDASGSSAFPPRIFFVDLPNGPATGGFGGEGTIVTIYGARFGIAQGTSTITLAGNSVGTIHLWSDTRIAFSVGTSAATGAIVVTTSAGSSNADHTFTVRAGALRCVSPTGSNGATGLFGACWATIRHAVATAAPGDITYAQTGTDQVDNDPFGNVVWMEQSGAAADRPSALVVFPGSTVTLRSTENWVTVVNGDSTDHWILAGFTIRANREGIHAGTRWRIIANDVMCDGLGFGEGCLAGYGVREFTALGNVVHDSATIFYPNTYGIYADGAAGAVVDIGHNVLNGNRVVDIGVNVNTASATIDVHDNEIGGGHCTAMLFDGNPVSTVGNVINNVVRQSPTGPDARSFCRIAACIDIEPATPAFSVIARHNTFDGCGADVEADDAAFRMGAGASLVLYNNAIRLDASERFEDPTGSPGIVGNFNAIEVAGTMTSLLFNTVPGPLRLAPTPSGLPLAGSPLIDAVSTMAEVPLDIRGFARPIGSRADIGAYERTPGD